VVGDSDGRVLHVVVVPAAGRGGTRDTPRVVVSRSVHAGVRVAGVVARGLDASDGEGSNEGFHFNFV
jgi:hypothetical protein